VNRETSNEEEAMTATTLPAGRLAALDQAIAAHREAVRSFAYMTGTGEQVRAAEAELRRIGRDDATGLVTLPVAAVHFTDVRADGMRMHAVNGQLDGEMWICWGDRHSVDCRTYDAYDLIQVRA
jgi:hypothetical protein